MRNMNIKQNDSSRKLSDYISEFNKLPFMTGYQMASGLLGANQAGAASPFTAALGMLNRQSPITAQNNYESERRGFFTNWRRRQPNNYSTQQPAIQQPVVQQQPNVADNTGMRVTPSGMRQPDFMNAMARIGISPQFANYGILSQNPYMRLEQGRSAMPFGLHNTGISGLLGGYNQLRELYGNSPYLMQGVGV
jgi:hypothetical protein